MVKTEMFGKLFENNAKIKSEKRRTDRPLEKFLDVNQGLQVKCDTIQSKITYM